MRGVRSCLVDIGGLASAPRRGARLMMGAVEKRVRYPTARAGRSVGHVEALHGGATG